MSTTPYQDVDHKLNSVEGHNSATNFKRGNELCDRNPPIALDLSIRCGRLALLTAFTVAVLVVLTAVFNHGVEFSRFEARSKNDTQQTKLLDDYNSYTGNVSSAFGKPIEAFVSIVVQIIVLRFMITSMLKPEVSWKVGAVTIGLSAGIGYLISNGFNALNVQLRPLPIQPVISAVDLANDPINTTSAASTNISNIAWTKTVSENTPKNPITNTILRQIVTTRVQKPNSLCDWVTSLDTGLGMIPDTTMDFGFTQRDWQKRVLQEALQPKQLRYVVNATDKTINKDVKASELPMNASLAADLFIYNVLMTQWLAGTFHRTAFPAAMKTVNPTANTTEVTGPLARLTGLLPPANQRTSELDERRWLLQNFQPQLASNIGNGDMPFLTSNMVTEFSHVDITEHVTFDSVTIELDVDPTSLVNATQRVFQERQCGPWPGLCLFEKGSFYSDKSFVAYDVPVQIGAIGACVNAAGVEVIDGFVNTDGSLSSSGFVCPQRSNSSMLIVSVGKRLVADSLQQNVTSNSTSDNRVIVKNLRKVYSFTVARLAWKVQDLAAEFSATCDTTACQGLQLPLASLDNETETSQRLVVGAESFPLASLTPLGNLFDFRPRMLPLVQVNELPRIPSITSNTYTVIGGDPLLLHNIKTTTWDNKTISTRGYNINTFRLNGTCNTFVEDRLYMTIQNHMYMEYSLQPAYTAATFFLFQNGVVKDTVKLPANRLTLNFQHNIQELAVFASIPDRNAWFTFGGCIALVSSLGAVILFSTHKKRATGGFHAEVTDPHMIAAVMFNENQFPPMVLNRRVVGGDHEGNKLHQVDRYVIDGLSLQSQNKYEQAQIQKDPIV